jgi:hypothetical protein
VHKRIIPAFTRVEFVSDRMSCSTLRGRWCHNIVLKVHAPTKNKTYDVNESFYEELECIFDDFLKYNLITLLGELNVKLGKKHIFKPIIWNQSLYEIKNYNGFRVINFATSKNLTVKRIEEQCLLLLIPCLPV